MADSHGGKPTAHIIDARKMQLLDVLGPTIQLLTEPDREGPCVMLGTIPPGVFVPLHSHADPETFLVLSGEAEALVWSAEGPTWVPVRTGDFFHVPGGAPHAFRNPSRAPVAMVLVSTSRLGRFFQETGAPAAPGAAPAWPPAADRVAHFIATAERYGYWNAMPDENAAVGLPALPAPGAD
jgi:quercetin dioxygenase-like cupin family protein